DEEAGLPEAQHEHHGHDHRRQKPDHPADDRQRSLRPLLGCGGRALLSVLIRLALLAGLLAVLTRPLPPFAPLPGRPHRRAGPAARPGLPPDPPGCTRSAAGGTDRSTGTAEAGTAAAAAADKPGPTAAGTAGTAAVAGRRPGVAMRAPRSSAGRERQAAA